MSKCQRVVINGILLRCGHCGSRGFASRKVQLNTALAEFFSAGWLNQSADVFICAKCAQIHWFQFQDETSPERMITEVVEECDVDDIAIEGETAPVRVVAEVDSDRDVDGINIGGETASDPDMSGLDDNYDVECMQCGQMIPAGQSACVRCGWTYKV